jgi:S-adenosylmethionine/arginine decarboxylase-like enzyme|tara:strand:+ start:3112 stop:3396 length:285 start_codon:yes stop_codon:yes gene_type:complete
MKAQIYNFAVWIKETNPKKLKENFNNLLLDSGFEILDIVDKHFEPYGYTVLFLLSESHLAIHTFPEHKETYIELSSCVKPPFNLFVKNYENRQK